MRRSFLPFKSAVATALVCLIAGCNMRAAQRANVIFPDTGEDGPHNRQFTGTHVQCEVLSGLYFQNQNVCYVTTPDGLALFEGDIVLGRASELKNSPRSAVARVGAKDYRWEGAIVPYTIEPDFPDRSRIQTAIDHFHLRSRVRFIPRENQTNYITFRRWAGCSSAVGRVGGEQYVNIGPGCSTGAVIHELMHVLGFWHEHSRKDRDPHVQIHWENIQTGWEHNFNQQLNDSDSHQPYDFESITHYSEEAYSNGKGKTISRLDGGTVVGQLTALSAGDLLGIEQLYFSALNFNEFISWNPLDKHASFNLSNQNLTAKASAVPAFSSPLVRATHGRNRGKFYWEMTADTNGYHTHNDSQPITHMVCILAGVLTEGQLHLSYEPKGCLYKDDVGDFQSGEIRCPGHPEWWSITADILEVGDLLGIAVDLDQAKIYFSKNGIWRTGDPLQLRDGVPLPIPGATYFPAVATECNSASGQITANFGQHAFRYKVPPSFMPGWRKP